VTEGYTLYGQVIIKRALFANNRPCSLPPIRVGYELHAVAVTYFTFYICYFCGWLAFNNYERNRFKPSFDNCCISSCYYYQRLFMAGHEMLHSLFDFGKYTMGQTNAA